MKKMNWIWMPHAGHFIGGHRCSFKLNTCVGEYIVSTVGEFRALDGEAIMEIGSNRTHETMVFRAKKGKYKCCPFEAIVEGGELDFRGYKNPEDAYIGHLELCRKWSKKTWKKSKTKSK